MNAPSDLLPLIAQYRAGLEAEIAMLGQLSALAAHEREATASGSVESLNEISDARDRLMANLVTVESQMRPIRQTLASVRDQLKGRDEFAELTALHQRASALAEQIIGIDDHTLASLREAELARHFAAESLEKSESTLAAYRRVVSPSLEQATLVNRRG